MKKIAIIIIALTSSVSLFAQEPDQPERAERPRMDPMEMAKKTVSKISEEITLQFVQQDSLTAIFTKFYSEMGKSRESGDYSAVKQLKSDRDAKVKAMLTPANYELYVKFMKKQQDQFRSNRSGGGHGQGGRGRGGFGGQMQQGGVEN
jgi:hypothetical protein